MRQRPGLAPTRHPAVDEARVARQAHVGAKAKVLHLSRTHAFEQAVGLLREFQHDLDAMRRFEIDGNRSLAAMLDRRRAEVGVRTGRLCALHHDHIRAKIGQQHGTERPRADALDL
jgi:hypothetical protein